MDISAYYQEDRYHKDMIAWRDQHYYPLRLQMLKDKLNITFSGNILDAGCWDGSFSKVIHEQFPDTILYGADISKKGCKLAKRYCKDAKVADFNKKIPYKSNMFDTLLAQEVIEHLLDPDTFLEECYRVLKPGGKLILTTPNLLAWYQRIFCLLGIIPTFMELSTKNKTVGLGWLNKILHTTNPVGHIRVFNLSGLADIVRLYGFNNISIKGASIYYPFLKSLQFLYDALDAFFAHLPSLSSNLLLVAEKPKTL